MGMFDDLIPSAAKGGGGLFDDLIPQTPKIDYSRPIPQVRADIAKLPEGPQRDKALREWADAYVAKEREEGRQSLIPGWRGTTTAASDLVRNFARGTIVGSFADELNAGTNAALHKVTGGLAGAPYDESVEYQRALDRAADKDAPVGSTVTKVAGGLLSAAPVAKALLATATSTPVKSILGGGLGGAYSYVAGFGEGEGDLEARHEKGLERVPAGVGIGLALPPGVAGTAYVGGKISDALSPSLARLGATLENLPRRIGILASADGAVPASAGAQAAADQMIANQLSRAGIRVEDLRKRLDEAARAGRFHTSGQAQDALAVADLDPALQRLAGSAARASPEAANTAKTFMEARQTGLTPVGQSAPQIAASGLPTRAPLAKPMTGREAAKALDSRFGTPEDKIVPMGQGERLEDAFKRAMLLEAEKFHGHGANAFRTAEQIAETARAEAQPAYQAFYRAGDNVDIRPALAPVLKEWIQGDRLAKEAPPVQALVRRIASLFAPDGNIISNAERFDRTKQYVDAKIANFFESSAVPNRHVGKLLNDLKNDLLKAVDAIPDVGPKYQAARSNWGSHMEAKKAIELGRDVWKEGSDVGLDAFRAMVASGNEKLFRLGLLDGYRLAAARMKRGADKTQLFDNPRIQEILSEVIPRTETATGRARVVGGKLAEFANRPERFGGYIALEKRMAETPRVVQGGSPTQRNIKDDEAYTIMSKFSETVEQFKSSASVTMLGVRAVEQMLGKLFGMRADTAAAIAQRLFTANPAERARVLAAVEKRLGRNRFEQFARLMNEYQRNVTAAGARQLASPETE